MIRRQPQSSQARSSREFLFRRLQNIPPVTSTWTASQSVSTKDMSFPSASLPRDLHSEKGYAFTILRMARVLGLLTARLIFRNSGNVLRWSATSSEMSSVALLMKSVSWSFWRWAETNGRWSWQRERCVSLGFSFFFFPEGFLHLPDAQWQHVVFTCFSRFPDGHATSRYRPLSCFAQFSLPNREMYFAADTR